MEEERKQVRKSEPKLGAMGIFNAQNWEGCSEVKRKEERSGSWDKEGERLTCVGQQWQG